MRHFGGASGIAKWQVRSISVPLFEGVGLSLLVDERQLVVVVSVYRHPSLYCRFPQAELALQLRKIESFVLSSYESIVILLRCENDIYLKNAA